MPYSELLKRISKEEDIFEIEQLLCHIRSKRRRGDPGDLSFLLEKNIPSLDQELALTLKAFRHKNSRAMLEILLEKTDDDTREFAAESMLALYGNEVINPTTTRRE